MGSDDGHDLPPGTAGLVDVLESLQREWLRAATDLAEQAGGAWGAAGGRPEPGEGVRGGAASGDVTGLVAPLLRAQAVWLEGGLRYMGRLSQAHGSHLPELYRRLADASPDGLDERARRELNDEMRAYLRELADVSLQEARVLERRLGELELAIREPDPDDASGAPVRRARAKD